MDETKQPGVHIAQIFLDNVSFRHREDYLKISSKTTAEVGDVEMQFTLGVTPDESKGIIRARVSTKPENDPIYSVGLTMTALITRDPSDPNMTIADYASLSGVPLMVSFLRQAFADITLRGRFGPVWIDPVNLRISGNMGDLCEEAPSETKSPRRKKATAKKRRPKKTSRS